MVIGPAYGDGFAGSSNESTPVALYLKGNEFTDGSLRLIPSQRGASDQFDVQFRQRRDGVWNNTGIKVSGATIHLAEELDISGAGEWIRTLETSGDHTALVPNVEFDDLAGTGRARSPVVDTKIIRSVVESDDTSEVVGTSLQSSFTATSSALGSKLYFKVGSVGATNPVNLKLIRGIPPGRVFVDQQLPVSLMATPGAEFTIDLPGMTETNPGDVFFGQMTSSTTISLKSSAAGVWFFAADSHPFGREEILLENLVVLNDAGLVLANDTGFVVTEFF